MKQGPSFTCVFVIQNLTIPNQLLDNNNSLLQYDWCPVFIMFLYSLCQPEQNEMKNVSLTCCPPTIMHFKSALQIKMTKSPLGGSC